MIGAPSWVIDADRSAFERLIESAEGAASPEGFGAAVAVKIKREASAVRARNFPVGFMEIILGEWLLSEVADETKRSANKEA